MPSWNIHAAHVERLLSQEEPLSLGVRDANCFLFGNFVPDVYVGYLVPDVSHTLRYCDTHVTKPHAIPIPGASDFWDDEIEPYIAEGGVDDLTLGVWAHLVADNRYNTLVRAFNAKHHIASGNKTRIRKQSDFDHFGKELAPSMRVSLTDELIAEAASFGPYRIDADDVKKAIVAADELLDVAGKERISHTSDASSVGPAPSAKDGYLLLSKDFLHKAFNATDAALREGLHRYVSELCAAGGDPAAPAPWRAPRRKGFVAGPPLGGS